MEFVEKLRPQLDSFEENALAKCTSDMSEYVYYADSQRIRKRKRHHHEYNTEEDVTMTDKLRVNAFCPLLTHYALRYRKVLKLTAKFVINLGFYPI